MSVDKTVIMDLKTPVILTERCEVPILHDSESEGCNLPSAVLHQTESNQINSNEFCLIKLPTFWHKNPKLWFAQLESEFLVYRIRLDDVKFSSILRHLDEQAVN